MWIRLLVFMLVLVLTTGFSATADEVKTGHTCGCAVDAYSVYGAGQDTCKTYLNEFAANPDSNQTDGSFGQTLGWLAGYMSATNRAAGTRDVLNMELDYLTQVIADWCQQNPEKMLSEAMDTLTDSRSGSSVFFQ